MTAEKTRTKIPASYFWDDFMPAPGQLARWERDCRVMGTVVGMAVGDALGAPYELNGRQSFGNAVFGKGTFGHGVAQWTDDSEEGICVLRGKSDPAAVAENLMEWFAGHPKDIGGQTRAVLGRVSSPRGMAAAARAYARRQEAVPRPPGWHPGTGNGSLMRTGPVCLPFLGDRARVARAARQISDLTHASPWDEDATVIWSLLVNDAIEQGPDFSLHASVADGLDAIPQARREVWATLAEVALRAASPATRFVVNGSAFGAFAAALWSVAHHGDYESTIQGAIAIGNDTDTVGAVAGSLAGARYGVLEIPSKWYRKIWGWPGMDARGLAALALEAAVR